MYVSTYIWVYLCEYMYVPVYERYSRKVPEDEHEAPFLIEYVPGGGDELLSLHTDRGWNIQQNKSKK